MADRAIDVQQLQRTYPGGVRALDGVTFEVRQGEVFGLLGPNGAGKSTTIRILATLARPDGGSARIFGHDVVRDARAVRRALGYVPQISGIDMSATGRENLVLQGQLQRMRRNDIRPRVTELLELLGVAEVADRRVSAYSGGIKRRFDIALALMHRPRLIVLDEPTTGLDPEVRVAMWAELERLVANEHVTILLTTHYLEEADRLAHRLAFIDRGRVVTEGTPSELKRDLKEDSVTLELVDGRVDDAVRELTALGEVAAAALDATQVRVRVMDGAAVLPAMLGRLEASGIKVARVAIAGPSLDDVYLAVTGREFATADRAEEAVAR